jgi:hypothetical protein
MWAEGGGKMQRLGKPEAKGKRWEFVLENGTWIEDG